MARLACGWLAVIAICLASGSLRGDDWPAWGRDLSRNAVSSERGAPVDFAFDVKDDKGNFTSREKGIAWSAPLGNRVLGAPVVASGLVWIGTNNEFGRGRPDASVLVCLREADGKELYRYVSPRLGTNYAHDWPFAAMGSTPTIEGDRLWFITNRSEVVGLDIAPLQRGAGEPKVAWKIDLIKDYGVYPHYPGMAGGFRQSVAVYKDWLYAVTSNGVDEGHINLPAPNAPSLVCLEKAAGKLVWKDNSPGKAIMHEQVASPLVLEAKGRAQVVVGQGDGWLRSFDPATGKLLWKCDLNPKGLKYELGGKSEKNYVVATPVYAEGRVYIAPGQDVEHYEGVGYLYCIDPTKDGDVSLELEGPAGKGKPNPNSAVIWRYGGKDSDPNSRRDYLFSRTISNCTVRDGLLYVPDIAGYFYCFDAASGKLHWVEDLKASVWGNPLWVDGKVYVATEDGDTWIFAHGPDKKLLRKIDMSMTCRASPIFANGTLYLPLEHKLVAIREKK